MSLQKLAAIVAHKYLCWSVSSHSGDCVWNCHTCWLVGNATTIFSNQSGPSCSKSWITSSNVFYPYPVENACAIFKLTSFDYNYQNSFRFRLLDSISQSKKNSLKTIALISSQKREDPRILLVMVQRRHRAIVLLVSLKLTRLIALSNGWTNRY